MAVNTDFLGLDSQILNNGNFSALSTLTRALFFSTLIASKKPVLYKIDQGERNPFEGRTPVLWYQAILSL